MPNNNDVSDALCGLAALACRTDSDLRAVVLRVATDLFVMKNDHALDEIRQFEEIAVHMLEDATSETRAAVAAKLATYGSAPASVVEGLLAHGGEAAAVLLEKSPAVGGRALSGAASFGVPALAAAVARRMPLDAALVRVLVRRSEPEVLLALVQNPSARISRATFLSLVRHARGDARLGRALICRADHPDELAPLFLAASSEMRAAIILSARRRCLGRPPQTPAPADAAFLRELEELAYAPDRRPFAAALAAAIGANADEMSKVVFDRGGEPLALVLAALGMTPQAATRIFLAGDPAVACSYERVAALRQIVTDVPPQTARCLVRRFLDGARPPLRRVAATDLAAEPTPSRNRSAALPAQTPQAHRSDLWLRRDADRARR